MTRPAKRPMPAIVAEVRREVCGRCDEPCPAYRAGQIDHADPAAECPRAWSGRWGCYGACGDPQIARPSVASAPQWPAKARRLAAALVRWARGGFGLVERRARAQRRAACEACDLYRPSGNLGFGECRHPACGCTRLKRWLPGERCPAGKWPA